MQQRAFHEIMQHVPRMVLPDEVDCEQANGARLPAVAINLAHRTDRWDAVSQRAAAVGLTKLIKAPAVDGRKLPDADIAAVLGAPADGLDASPLSHLSLTRPAVGCFLSHLAIWRWVIERNLPRVLILEDDANPAPGFDPARFRNLVASLPEQAGLVFFGCMIMGGLADRAGGADLARLYYFNGTFAYAITPEACRRLLTALLPPRTHIDHQISSVLIEQRHVFAAHYTEPNFFEPDWSLRSDCYVPLAQETAADRELDDLIRNSRERLLAEGRPLLPLLADA